MGSKTSGRRTPKRQKIIQGTFRADRNPKNEPDPTKVEGLPESPSYFGRHAAAMWDEVGRELVIKKVLTVVDLRALEVLCTSYQEFREAWDAVYLDDKGKRRTLRQYMKGRNSQTAPEFKALRQAKAEYRAFAAEFGITPASRNRIDLKDPDKPEDDPMEEILKAK